MRSHTVVLMTLLFLSGFPEIRPSAFGQPAARSEAEGTSAPDSRRSFFGVMGQISRPGVYELPTARPKLAEVVRRAGGLTANASRIIRVVRNGRIAFQTYYTPRLTLTLLPNDLLLVDGGRTDYQRSIGDVRPAGRIGSRARQPHAVVESQIEVAFVGLIDRPVVLRLRDQDATLGRVAQLLKQPAAVVKTMRLISPLRSGLKNHAPLLTPATPLYSGSVVVFGQAHLDAIRIPPLPKPIPSAERSVPSGTPDTTVKQPHSRVGVKTSDKRNDRHAIGHTVSAGQTRVVLASGEQLPPTDASTARDRKRDRVRNLLKSARTDLQQGRYDAARRKALAAQRAGVAFTLREDRPEIILEEIAKRTVASGTRKMAEQPTRMSVVDDRLNRTVSLSGHRASGNSSTRPAAVRPTRRKVPHRLSQLPPPIFSTNSPGLSSNDPFPSKPVSDRITTNAVPTAVNDTESSISSANNADAVGDSSEVAAAAEPDQSTAGLVLLLVVGGGVLAVGLAAVLLISMARTAVKTATTEQRHTGNDEALELLICNTIAIREEAVELPKELTLHGHSTGLRKLRIDASLAQLRGPHFAVTTDKTAAATDRTPAPSGLRVDPPQSVTDKATDGRRREPLGPPRRGTVQRDLLDRVLSTVNKVTNL